MTPSRSRRSPREMLNRAMVPARQLDRGVGAESEADSPWRQGSACLDHASASIDEHGIDRETHEECVDGAAGGDDECEVLLERVSSEQTPSPGVLSNAVST